MQLLPGVPVRTSDSTLVSGSRLLRFASSSAWHIPLIVLVSVGYESLFLHHWLNPVDEGWPLYSAMKLHAGGTLYDDVFFVFPPGHVLVAWLAYAFDPPGLVLSRLLYAAFNVGLCVAFYQVARKVMPPGYALFAALLLAVAAPFSHRTQLLFGYRYLLFSTLALLAFAKRLRSEDPRWMWVSGLCVGIAVCFRLTPAFAVSVGIGVAVLVSQRDWRSWLRDGALFGAGILCVAVPVVLWFGLPVGFAQLWREVVVRPVVMTELQGFPVPDLFWPGSLERDAIHDAWVSLLFRIVPLLYSAYVLGLGLSAYRAFRAGRRFDHALLVAIVVWGFVYFFRSLGRSDEPHLSSAIPPFCVVVAHAIYTGMSWLDDRRRLTVWRRRGVASAVCASVFLAWFWLPGSDRHLSSEYRGNEPLDFVEEGVRVRSDDWWHRIRGKIEDARAMTEPGDTVLDLTAWSLLYVILDRPGPGYHDITMPGTFLDEAEELAYVDRLEADPPALIFLGPKPFDAMIERSTARHAPRLMEWISRRYSVVGTPEHLLLMRPRPLRDFGAP